MFAALRRHPFAVEAFFRHSLVLTYASPAEVLQPVPDRDDKREVGGEARDPDESAKGPTNSNRLEPPESLVRPLQ